MNDLRLGFDWRWCSTWLAAGMLAAAGCAGCDPTCRVTVVVSVTGSDGIPVNGATVTDVGQCNPGVECVRVTETDGRATFTRTTLGGEGQIRVEKAGFVTVTEPYSYECGTYNIPVALRR